MGKAFLSFLVVCLFSNDPFCLAQSTFQVSDPMLELRDNVVYISYEILNSTADDRFIVTMTISDPEGNRINARALEGDIGGEVYGGGGKQIAWDLAADRIVMNAEILVSIAAELVPPIQTRMQEETVDPVIREEAGRETAGNINRTGSISSAGIILQSLPLPGLGMSRATGKPHWIRGIAGYGCIAGAVVLNRMAISTYEDFKVASLPDDAESLLAEAASRDNLSEVLAYAAAGVWVTDIIWNLVGSSRLKNRSIYGHLNRISLTTGFNPLCSVPVIGFRIKF